MPALQVVWDKRHDDHVSCAGQNLSDVSKLGCFDLDPVGKCAGELRSHVVQKSGGRRRVALEASMLNYLLQEDSSARNRQSVRTFCS